VIALPSADGAPQALQAASCSVPPRT